MECNCARKTTEGLFREYSTLWPHKYKSPITVLKNIIHLGPYIWWWKIEILSKNKAWINQISNKIPMEEVFVNLTCINQTLNKIPMEEIFVNLTCINQTLNKIPMEEVFVNLTCINQTLNKIPMEEIFVNLTCINQTK